LPARLSIGEGILLVAAVAKVDLSSGGLLALLRKAVSTDDFRGVHACWLRLWPTEPAEAFVNGEPLIHVAKTC
jgi:hypothetical protein